MVVKKILILSALFSVSAAKLAIEFRKIILKKILGKDVVLYTSKLSPFGLKISFLLKSKHIPFIYSSELNNSFKLLLIEFYVLMIRFGFMKLDNSPSKLGELPLVPYLFMNNGMIYYDSTQIGNMLLINNKEEGGQQQVTKEEFICQLLDEFFDEFGLYLVHFERWTNINNHVEEGTTPGDFLSREELFNPKRYVSFFIPNFIKNAVATFFNQRQTRRLSYLFAVGPTNPTVQKQVGQVPPHQSLLHQHETWSFLKRIYRELLYCCETIFNSRSSIFKGEKMTLADASLFGQLNMNARQDLGTRKEMIQIAPCTVSWLDSIEKNTFSFSTTDDNNSQQMELDDKLIPLMNLVIRVFLPIMQQNEREYEKIMNHSKTEKIFNETAFEQGKSLYIGQVDGISYKAVVKTFQVETWRKLKDIWKNKLSSQNKQELNEMFQGIRNGMEES